VRLSAPANPWIIKQAAAAKQNKKALFNIFSLNNFIYPFDAYNYKLLNKKVNKVQPDGRSFDNDLSKNYFQVKMMLSSREGLCLKTENSQGLVLILPASLKPGQGNIHAGY
jgi:hypothetical protein